VAGDYVDHSISTLAVKAKSNLADCNIRIHSNPLLPLPPPSAAACPGVPASPLPFLLHPPYETAGAFMLSSLGPLPPPPLRLTLHGLFSLFLLPSPFSSFSCRRSISTVVTAARALSREPGESPHVNSARGLVTIEAATRQAEPRGSSSRRLATKIARPWNMIEETFEIYVDLYAGDTNAKI